MPPSAKSLMSNKWFVRIDGDVNVLRPKVLTFISRIDCVSWLHGQHVGSKKENSHIHACIEMTSAIQKQSFALQIKKHFDVVDRNYALELWDGTRAKGAPTYIFHEKELWEPLDTIRPLWFSKNWCPAEVEEAQRIGKLIAEAVNIVKEKASTKLPERALEHFRDTRPDKFEILLYMMKEIQQLTAYHPGQFKLRQYVEEVEIRLTDNISRLAHEYFNSMWRI